jgi:hypothetical protein
VVDFDGDGIPELRHICTAGEQCLILKNETIEDINLAVLCPDPEPHTPYGQSVADLVTDIQFLKSNIWRKTLDSLAQTIIPRMGIVEGQVNITDALNNENSAVIRMRAPGMIQPIEMPFVGQYSLPMIAAVDDVRATRTGITKASMGLDPKVLQSTTKDAVANTISQQQGQVELVARIFAETGFKDLYRGIIRCLRRYQDRKRTVRLRDRWVDVDPRDWPDFDVKPNVALTRSSPEQRLAVLDRIASKQEQIINTYGPQNPLSDIFHYRNTLVEMVQLAGIKDTDKFFRNRSGMMQMLETQQAQAAKNPQGQQDPATQAAQAMSQAEIGKAQIKAMTDQQKLATDIGKQMQDDDRERDKMELDAAIRLLEINAKYGAQFELGLIRAITDRQREEIKAASAQRVAAMRPQPASGGARKAAE